MRILALCAAVLGWIAAAVPASAAAPPPSNPGSPPDTGAWTPVRSRTTADLFAVSFPDVHHGHAVGSAGAILETGDGGLTWAREYACAATTPCLSTASDVITRRLLAVDFVDAFHGWAVGDGGTILSTTDGGRSWLARLACAETSIDVVREYCNPYSADRVTVDLHGVSFVDALHGWAVGDRETILSTADGGNTWVQQIACTWAATRLNPYSPCPPRPGASVARTLDAVSFVNASRGLAVGSQGLALWTGDGGQSWTHDTGTTALELRGATMVVPGYADATYTPSTQQASERQDTAHAVGVGGTLLISGAKGVSWYGTGGLDQLTTQPPATTEDLNAVDFSDRINGIAVGDHGAIERTSDEGSAWHLEPSHTDAALHGVALPDANHGFAVGDGGVILASRHEPVGLAVTGVTPKQVPQTGGIPVTIRGTGFVGADEVSFGKAWALGFTVDSDRQITAMPPPLSLGTVDVTVTSRGGTSDAVAADQVTLLRPSGGTWTATGTCPERCDGPAVRLHDGRVLVEGGHAGSVDPITAGATTAAEIYDPGRGTWTPTGSMHVPRVAHTATLLRDGRVLVAGGVSDVGADHSTASAEIYDPAAGRWTTTGSMHETRDTLASALLPDGTVLVAGGRGAKGVDTDTAELFDPGSGRWAEVGSMHLPRSGEALLLLRTGKVLAAGNENIEGALGVVDATTELYDPRSRTWSETGSMQVPSSMVTVTLLADGRALATGGRYQDVPDRAPTVFPFAEIYDPGMGTWTQTGPMVFARVKHSATLLPDGRVLVTGGVRAVWRYCPPCDPMTESEIYDPRTGAWTLVAPMNEARNAPTAVLLDDGGVLVTGRDGASEVFQPAPLSQQPAATGWELPAAGAAAALLCAGAVVAIVVLRRRRPPRGPHTGARSDEPVPASAAGR